MRIFFRGSFSSEFGKAALYLSLESADRYAERLIRTVCRQMGIEWTGRLLSRATVESPAWRLNYEPVSRVLSAQLPEIVRSINKDSLNAAAQSLFLALSDEHTNTASAVVVERWLIENGIDCTHLHLPSGSGLDEKTRVDAVFMGDLLARAHS
ncbi:D-alanyl-D-alanine carboxypeptidase, partial [Sutterella massiliensis]|nr:D-alanyl-D-alanine carboxypeptidase [Sutterella massiliensis]